MPGDYAAAFRSVEEEDPELLELENEAREKEQVRQEFQDVSRWCRCDNCKLMPTRRQNVCCKNHNSSFVKMEGLKCITEHVGVDQLLQEAPLEMAYNQFLVYHDAVVNREGQQQVMAKKRFCGYRNLVFWLNPGIRKHQRTPLPACIYAYIQDKFPPVSHEDDGNSYEFSLYMDL